MHHKRTRWGGEQRGTTVKATKGNETWCQANAQVSSLNRPNCPQLPKLMSGDEPGIATAASPGRLWAVRGWPTTTSNNQRRPQPRSSSAEWRATLHPTNDRDQYMRY